MNITRFRYLTKSTHQNPSRAEKGIPEKNRANDKWYRQLGSQLHSYLNHPETNRAVVFSLESCSRKKSSGNRFRKFYEAADKDSENKAAITGTKRTIRISSIQTEPNGREYSAIRSSNFDTRIKWNDGASINKLGIVGSSTRGHRVSLSLQYRTIGSFGSLEDSWFPRRHRNHHGTVAVRRFPQCNDSTQCNTTNKWCTLTAWRSIHFSQGVETKTLCLW